MKIDGNTILVTGGTSGIGLELATRLRALGNEVLVTGRDPQALERARQRGLVGIESDVADPRAIVALRDQLSASYPRLNVLVNNAGVMRRIDLGGADLDDVTREVDINLGGLIRTTCALLPQLTAQPHATIMNVSSGIAFVPFPVAPVYSATKAGVHAFTRALRVQLRRTNVRVLELIPPAVDTPLGDPFADDMKGVPVMSVTKVVDAAVAGLRHDTLEIRPGVAKVLALLGRLVPGMALRLADAGVDRMLDARKLLVARSE